MHMLLSTPTDLSPSQIAQYLKGRSLRLILRRVCRTEKEMFGGNTYEAERALNDPDYIAPDAVRQEALRVLEAIDAGNKFPEDMERTEAIMGTGIRGHDYKAICGLCPRVYANPGRGF